jgi:hypothetical protein
MTQAGTHRWTDEQKRRNQLAAQIRRDAETKLRELYKEEFDQIHGDMREKAGLPRVPNSKATADELRKRVTQLEVELELERQKNALFKEIEGTSF